MRSGAVVVAAGLVLALAGCVPSTPYGTDSPESVATPVFTSDAAALKAAETAYAAYLRVSDQIANDGGKDPERIDHLATGKLLTDDLAGFNSFVKKGWHSVGATLLTGTALQSAALNSGANAKGAVSVYLCEDVSHVDVVDSRGTSVVASSRPAKQQFQVTFDVVKSELVPSEREPWSGSNICG